MGARYYAPSLGRWISEDAYRGEISDPLSLNLYVFCINNPLIYVDPSGYAPWDSFSIFNRQSLRETIVEPIGRRASVISSWYSASSEFLSGVFRGGHDKPEPIYGAYAGNALLIAIPDVKEDTLMTLSNFSQYTSAGGETIYVYVIETPTHVLADKTASYSGLALPVAAAYGGLPAIAVGGAHWVAVIVYIGDCMSTGFDMGVTQEMYDEALDRMGLEPGYHNKLGVMFMYGGAYVREGYDWIEDLFPSEKLDEDAYILNK